MGDAIVARFGMDNSKFKRGMRENQKNLHGMGKAMKSVKAGIAGLITGVAIGALKSFVDELDQIGKSADEIGVTTDSLQELRFAAEQTGGSASKLDKALAKFNNSLGEARQGTGEGKKAFEELGVAIRNADGTARNNEETLRDFADKLDGIVDPATRAAYVNDAMGRSAGFMLNTLKGGSAALDEYANQLNAVGGAIDEEAIRRAEDLNDRLNILSKTISGTLTAAYLMGSKGFEKMFVGIDTALETVGLGIGVASGKELQALANQEAAIKKSQERVKALKQVAIDGDAAAAAKAVEAQKDLDKMITETEARRIAVNKEREANVIKMINVERRLRADLAKYEYDQLSTTEKKEELERKVGKVTKANAREQFELLKKIAALDKELASELEEKRDAQEDINNTLSTQAEERDALKLSAKAEADEAVRKAEAEVESLHALQGQAIARIGSQQSGRVVKLRKEATEAEDKGNFGKAERLTGRADKLQDKITDRRRDKFFDRAREAAGRGDTGALERLKKQGKRQGFLDSEGRDARRTVGEERKEANEGYQQKMEELASTQAEEITGLRSDLTELISKFE